MQVSVQGYNFAYAGAEGMRMKADVNTTSKTWHGTGSGAYVCPSPFPGVSASLPPERLGWFVLNVEGLCSGRDLFQMTLEGSLRAPASSSILICCFLHLFNKHFWVGQAQILAL